MPNVAELIKDQVTLTVDSRSLSIGLRHLAREITDASPQTRLERRSSVAVG
jgi:hypothetical protein